MDPNYANAGGGGGGGGIIGGNTTAVATAAAPAGVSSTRYNPAFYKDSYVSCQRSVPPPYNTYDPYGVNSKVSSTYPYDAEAEFKVRTGMGKAKVLAGNVASTSSAKLQHSYNPSSCYGGSCNQSNAPESANLYAYAYDQQQQQQQHHHYTQQQQQQYHHQSQLQQQYKYNKLVAAQQQQQQQQHHQHPQQQKISPPEYGYGSYHHPYYHPHYHHPSTQKGVAVMKTIPDASSSMPYVSSKMMTARAPQYPSNYTAFHHHQNSYPPVVTAGHQHTYQSQSVCEDSRWIWNSSSGNEYPNSSCRSATYPAYVNGSGVTAGVGAKQQHNTIWPPHSMPIQYQSTGYPAAAALTSSQSCCPPPPTQSSATTYYPQQYVKYPMHQSAVDYNNDLYGNSSQGSATAATASGKVYTDLSGNSYQQTINNSVAFHHQQQQPGEYSVSSALDYNNARYLQQQQPAESPLSSTSSSTSSYNHNYYHPYPTTYSNVESNQERYQQQVDTKIKSQSLRDFLTTWNEDEDEMNTTEVPFMEQLHLTSDHFAQDNGGIAVNPPLMENHLQFKGSFSSSSRPKIHVGITVDSTVESDQYINLPDIIIDIEKSNKDIVSLPEDCLVSNISKINKDDLVIKEEKPNIEDEVVTEETHPKKQPNQIQRENNYLRRKIGRANRLRRQHRLAKKNHRKSKIVRRKLIRRHVKIPTTCNPQSLKCLCVSLINSEKFRKRILGPRSEIDNLLIPKTTTTRTTTTTADADIEVNIDAVEKPSSSSVIPKLSDLCKNALNSSFDRDVLVINLDEILDSDNLFVVQCDINENILGNFVEETDQQPENSRRNNSNSSKIINNTNEEDLVEILNDNINNYNNNSSVSGNSNIRDIFTPVPNDIEQLKRCCSVTEVSNLPLDNSFEHNNFNLPSTNSNVLHSPSPSPLTPPSILAGGSVSCPATFLFDGRGHDRLSFSSSSLIEQNCLTQKNISVSPNTDDDNNQQLHEMLMLSGIVQQDFNKDTSTILPNNANVECSNVVTTPSIHHEEIVPDNLKKFQNEKFLKYLHAKYVQGNLSEFYHANRIIKKYKKRIIKKLLNIVR